MATKVAMLGEEKGFTLVEVVVVLVIVGILTAIALPRYINITNQAKERACAANIKAIETAAMSYAAAHNGQFPASVASLYEGGYLKDKPKCPMAEAGEEISYTIDARTGTVTCNYCDKDNED